jgi:hypothetical protein
VGITSRRAIAALGVAAAAAAGLVGAGGPARAVEADQALSGVASAQYQTNNEVDALVAGGGVLYAGGMFTSVRPPGSGTATTRTYLAAFSTGTGAVTGFRVTLNGRVRALALSADRATLFLGGDFTTVNGAARPRLAAVSTASGALRTGFAPNPDSRVTALALTGPTLYAGGDFTRIGGRTRARLAALSPTSGAASATFTADLDARPHTLALDVRLDRLLVGGVFSTVNAAPQAGIAALDGATGAVRPWAATGAGNCTYGVRSIAVDQAADEAYVTTEADAPGCFEGVYKARVADGGLLWLDECAGAGRAVQLLRGQLYFASHTHDCGRMPGGFTGGRTRDTFVWYRLNVLNPATGEFGHWQPNTNAAGTTVVGPHVLATDGTQLFVGGDFSTVNGAAQQGITRFVPKGADAAPATPAAPVARSTGVGRVTVTVPGSYDRDNGLLSYELVRADGSVVATATAESWAFSMPALTLTDTASPPGAAVRYRVRVRGGAATSGWSPWSATETVRTTAPDPHATAVLAAGPELFWRLDGAGGFGADSSGNGRTATVTGALPVDGVTAGNTGARLDGVGGEVAADAPTALGTAWSTSLWFRSSSRLGGALAGRSDAASGPGTTTDRVIWLDNDGKVVTALQAAPAAGAPPPRPGRTSFTLVRSPLTYTDGRWHHVTATYDGTTLRLYVDGTSVGSAAAAATAPLAQGYLRAGYVDLARFYSVFGINFSGTPAPSSYHLDGSLDEIAGWSTALTAEQVAGLFVSGAAGI